jgi:3-deoxy-manno-octulosonate cytidylyltransferase (CMP-KDO synthetase)
MVATGDQEIIDVVSKNGGVVIKTNLPHTNGLSRIHEATSGLDFTHVLVLQGDEILVLPEQIDSLLHAIKQNPSVDFWNLTTQLESVDEISNPSVVKCVLGLNRQILYIFRETPLVGSEQDQLHSVRKICGLFAVSKEALNSIFESPSTPLEESQSIEQLKYLELGGIIMSVPTSKNFPSINLEQDISKVEDELNFNPQQQEILSRIL